MKFKEVALAALIAFPSISAADIQVGDVVKVTKEYMLVQVDQEIHEYDPENNVQVNDKLIIDDETFDIKMLIRDYNQK